MGVGLLMYAPIAYLLAANSYLTTMAFGLVVISFSSYAPDFDLHINSLQHRGKTHTIFGALIGSTLFGLIAIALHLQGMFNIPVTAISTVQISAAAFLLSFIGFMSHLVGDVLTPMGITPFKPWSKNHYTLDIVNANNKRANELLWEAGTFGVIGAIVLGVLRQSNQLAGLVETFNNLLSGF